MYNAWKSKVKGRPKNLNWTLAQDAASLECHLYKCKGPKSWTWQHRLSWGNWLWEYLTLLGSTYILLILSRQWVCISTVIRSLWLRCHFEEAKIALLWSSFASKTVALSLALSSPFWNSSLRWALLLYDMDLKIIQEPMKDDTEVFKRLNVWRMCQHNAQIISWFSEGAWSWCLLSISQTKWSLWSPSAFGIWVITFGSRCTVLTESFGLASTL